MYLLRKKDLFNSDFSNKGPYRLYSCILRVCHLTAAGLYLEIAFIYTPWKRKIGSSSTFYIFRVETVNIKKMHLNLYSFITVFRSFNHLPNIVKQKYHLIYTCLKSKIKLRKNIMFILISTRQSRLPCLYLNA